jgi:hypothetical protein
MLPREQSRQSNDNAAARALLAQAQGRLISRARIFFDAGDESKSVSLSFDVLRESLPAIFSQFQRCALTIERARPECEEAINIYRRTTIRRDSSSEKLT